MGPFKLFSPPPSLSPLNSPDHCITNNLLLFSNPPGGFSEKLEQMSTVGGLSFIPPGNCSSLVPSDSLEAPSFSSQTPLNGLTFPSQNLVFFFSLPVVDPSRVQIGWFSFFLVSFL